MNQAPLSEGTSPVNLASGTGAARRGRSAGTRRVIYTISVVTVSTMVVESVLVVLFGRVEGMEFSPHTFSRRWFVYFVAPPFNVQVTPVWRWEHQTPVEAELVRQGWVSKTSVLRWDVVSGARGPQSVAPQPAAILCGYLDLLNERGRYFWSDWNAQHPNQAGILWPVVVAIARHGWYELLPDVFAAAREHANRGGSEFQQALHEALRRQVGLLRPHLEPADRTTLDALWSEVDGQLAAEARPPRAVGRSGEGPPPRVDQQSDQ